LPSEPVSIDVIAQRRPNAANHHQQRRAPDLTGLMLVGQARFRNPIECGYVAVREGVIVVIGIGANTRVVVDV
jgi:hypothetical protein